MEFLYLIIYVKIYLYENIWGIIMAKAVLVIDMQNVCVGDALVIFLCIIMRILLLL